ncbi:hypothetical protein [Micromonospora robiginosa]|uniref:Uncharacterized protein n=1 Tax=Micromonospora robiginosa TaxID=2749844 RepID=A0A7L6B3R3_9ACTN|nr:hypothetical protein [Micromonospora ferruginea]QLQ36586.1 hypothetical protein H1D33_25475 [Micromonospora ferruginea]
MRKIVGLLLVLYSVLLGFSVTLPLVASVAGPKVSAVTVVDPAACDGAIGFAPLAGIPQRCDVTWTTAQGDATGTIYGKTVDHLTAGSNTPTSAVHQLGNFAFTAPVGDTELMMAFLAPPILFLGLHALARKRRSRRHRRHGFDLDLDDDDDDSDDGDDGDD